ncbi:MAG: glycosyltransferase family 4 protein [Chlamydiales bacterium]|jgi:glycosyltransferase involved in cell wall biosynthesis|nr:glycosyltransferase family 4 protein [Chlamydiales bacterium]
MKIVHTESSMGWGGQEMRILAEAEGMRQRGHTVFFALSANSELVRRAMQKGFVVYTFCFKKKALFFTVGKLWLFFKKERIDLINTHSSLDAWIAGIAAKLSKKPVVRTRHLSTPIRGGLNGFILYNQLADVVVSTSSAVLPLLQEKAHLSPSRMHCIATGVNPKIVDAVQDPVMFREELGLSPTDILVGTACVLRSWKGIPDLLKAADLLKNDQRIKWILIGGGYLERYLVMIREMKLDNVICVGHLESPYTAIRALDVFTLLSVAHEGISQATLQAAFLKRPLITTDVGGLPEVCIHGSTGLRVPSSDPEAVAQAVLKMAEDRLLRERLGENAKMLVEQKYMMTHTLDQMESVYQKIIL